MIPNKNRDRKIDLKNPSCMCRFTHLFITTIVCFFQRGVQPAFDVKPLNLIVLASGAACFFFPLHFSTTVRKNGFSNRGQSFQSKLGVGIFIVSPHWGINVNHCKVHGNGKCHKIQKVFNPLRCLATFALLDFTLDFSKASLT